jgi:hypothetical protein
MYMQIMEETIIIFKCPIQITDTTLFTQRENKKFVI